ncbi:MAG: type IX secretion system outer membrane channel protein PorV [Prevotella sp.]|uniref:type IX secretion system outer membrane channel protein PorV n=1 Tax=Prevotella sp. AGR2160 TaxID=1280674 RepID=UPI000411AB2C|nr:type IX secretion system outer membrane channel protein PorV [Prevotella sp. AGR2160]MDD5861199.1 type IX secretion system outer membrane channel protein PorV [Prevotella sp.]
MNRNRIATLLLLALAATGAKADDGSGDYKRSTYNPVEYSVISQMIAPDARAGGMGDVGAATDPDVNSQAWNPAKYPFCISRSGVALNYTPWLRKLVNDMNMAYVAGYYRIGDYSAISSSLRYFSLGDVYYSSAGDDNYDMTIKPYEMSLDVAYSLMLSEKFSIAAAVRWIYSDLRFNPTEDSSPASAFAADLACYYQNYITLGQRECQLGLGLNISNIGSKITYSGEEDSHFIPTNMRIGASLMVPIDNYNRISFSADANKLLVPTVPTMQQFDDYIDQHKDDANAEYTEADKDQQSPYRQWVLEQYNNVSSISGIFKSFHDAPGGFKEELKEIQWSVGAEYNYNDRFAVRAGYHDENKDKGNRKYFTVGAGFKMSAFSLDAGYVIATSKSNPLDETLRFTLTFDMDGIKDLLHK